MKAGLTIISIVIALIIIGWGVWVNLDETAPEAEQNINEAPQLPSGQIDYSEITNLSDCQTIECALQMMDNDEIADFQLKNWLQSYAAITEEFNDCNWDWDLFEARIEEIKEIRQQMILENRRQSIGITCGFLQPAVL